MSPGRLLLAATPLGLPADASARLISALRSADVVAAEDTRRVRMLAAALEVRIAGRVVSLFDQNEATRVPALVDDIKGGATVLVVSDAGMPVINDPGYRLVAACVEAGLAVSCLPGPSAVTTALAISGLPADRFCFEGFPPRKHSARKTWLTGLAVEERTAVFFESPRRLAACLQDAVEVLGPDRRAVVCRELTKTHEEIVRGSLAELAEWAADGVLGEITV
ncbi:MAG: 16S rRNA (cytidine(1402)-2'-O)-methyltransferase, partial [Mycobacterium sp.]